MTFTPEQVSALQAKLDPRHVATRSQSGRQLSYIEGWWAIAEANRIFGFDGWTSEIVELRCVTEAPRKVGQSGADGYGVSYVGRVRITIDGVVREAVGAGHGIDRDLGLAHESAIKECETDSRKRCLMTFGNPFGLALYDKTQANVGVTDLPANTLGNSRATKDNPYESRAIDPEAEFPGVPDGNRGKTSHFARQAGDDKLFKEISAEIVTLESPAAVGAFIAGRKDAVAKMPADWRATLKEELEAQRVFIRQANADGHEDEAA